MSSLETSITLEDVFTVVEAKRVPLAPELAGYLTLEIADGTDAGSGDVEPKTVFISEEGTVALVRPKKDSITGNAEASVRALLTKLLEASGSGTPALTTAAKRKPGNGLPALVEELEAALIPVNRAAGRRALARLVREVKRVLLGVGRNASAAPVQSRPEPKAPVVAAAPHARPALRKREDDRPSDPKVPAQRPGDPKDGGASLVPSEPALRRSGAFDDEAATAKRTNQLSELASSMNAVDGSSADDEGVAPEPPKTPQALPRSPIATRRASPRPPPAQLPPPPMKPGSSPPAPLAPPPKRDAVAPVITEARPDGAGPSLFGGDEVESLLDSFGVSSAHEDKQMARELKAIAGLSPTPPPPDAKTLAELTKDIGKGLPKKLDSSIDGDSVEALLALADASGPLPLPSMANDSIPPVAIAPPPIASAAGANLPPSPLFGGASASASAAAAKGAPAALRQASDSPHPPEPLRAEALAKPADPPKKPAPAPTASGARAKAEGSIPPSGPRTTGKRSRAASGGHPPRAPKTGMAMLVFALLVLAGGTVAVWKFAPQVFTGKKRPPASTAPSATPATPKCKVALVLTDVPANAEILLRVGQAPVDVERMPVGTRLELIATAEGYAPRRAVIKGESHWDNGPDGKPRIEVPIQLDPSKAKPGAIDPWPSAEPGSQVGGSGAPGTVHVVSNVRGAEVWLLAGLGPEARIDQLRCDSDIDVLFAGPPSLRKRLRITEKEIADTTPDAAGNKVVNVSAKEPAK